MNGLLLFLVGYFCGVVAGVCGYVQYLEWRDRSFDYQPIFKDDDAAQQ